MKSLNQFLEDKHSFMVNGPLTCIVNDKQFFVDLGLSVRWAKYNLGAKKETDPGHYYMWGSTKPNDNDDCCWENAPFNNSNKKFDPVYFKSIKDKICPNDILAHEYDAAYQESKGKYRMPTREEFEDLVYETDHEWIKIDNIEGWKLINKNDKNKYIFIPTAGYRIKNSFVAEKDTIGLLSSSLNPNYPGAFNFDDTDLITSSLFTYAYPIRPVQDKIKDK